MAISLCPHCQAELTAADEASNRCPSCGKEITVAPAGQASDDLDLDAMFAEEGDLDGVTLDDDAPADIPAEESDGIDKTTDFRGESTIEFVPDARADDEPPDSAATPTPNTDDAPGIDQTIDKPPTVGMPTDATISMDEPQIAAARRIAPMKPAARELSAAQTKNMTQTWQSSFSPKVDATMTLKPDQPGDGDGKDIGKSTLVVSPRAVREVKEPSTTGADYELLDVIGKGGMGVVYAARQASVDRTVAIKMLKPEAAKAAPQRGKFMTEAVVTGDLDHPNIVPIYELGTSETGSLFYSMKRVQGTPWSDVVADKSLSENIEILMKVADAVAFAHANGVIHRDLKPENVMLGDFGEVLVMDWGLALATSTFRHEQFITSADSMGGTPAYMAPEMATGPFDRIGFGSDVYLLGAVLFEVITGKTPHTGKNVRECLVSAARNDLQPVDTNGELLAIAYQAMATEVEDRYADVLAFQAAVREYLSHSESLVLSSRAEEELTKAAESDDYQEFARAVFAFQEALHLWEGNKTARDGQVKARVAYARSAQRREDFELGMSLLDAEEPAHAELLAELQKAQRETRARKRILKLFKVAAASLLVAFLIVVSVAVVWINAERNTALVAQKDAEKQRDIANDAKEQEAEERKKAEEARAAAVLAQADAEAQRDIANEARKKADEARSAAVVAENEAVKQRAEAEKQRGVALQQRDAAEEARRQEEYQAYIARIGLASAKTDENAFSDAIRLLDYYSPEQNAELAKLRHWEWGRLRYLCELSLRNVDAGAALDALAVSANGARFATGGRDGMARIWETATGRQLAEFPHDGAYVFAVAFSPDGKQLATGSSLAGSYLTLWNIEDGVRVGSYQGHTDAVLSVAFSRDGRRLLSSSYDGTAKLWNVDDTSKPVRDFVGHGAWVWSAVFSPDEQSMVTAGQDGTAIIWPVTGEPAAVGKLRKFRGHRGPVLCAAFSPDGRSVASGGYDHRVLLWQVAETQPFDLLEVAAGGTTEAQSYRTLEGHQAPVRSVAFSSDDRPHVLSSGDDNTVRVWDAQSGRLVRSLRGHSERVATAAFAPDGDQLLSASHDQQVKLWSLAGYQENQTFQGRALAGHVDAVLDVSFSPDGQMIATASRDRTARIWNAATGETVATLAEGHAFLTSRALFTSDGRRLITAAGDNTARIWEVATGTQQLVLVDTGRAAAIALSHDGQRIVTGSSDASLRLWNAETGERLKLPDAQFGRLHEAEVTACAFSPDDAKIFSGDEQGRGIIWDATSGAPVVILQAHSAGITAAHFLPGGERLLTSSNDGAVVQWDVAAGEEITSIGLAHPDSVVSMAVSSDGQRALTGCADGVVRLWDVAGAALLGSHDMSSDSAERRIQSVAFSPDDTVALVATSDNRLTIFNQIEQPGELTVSQTFDVGERGALVWSAIFAPDGNGLLTVGGNDARLWNTRTGDEMTTFSPHAAVAAASFSPDGRRVVTGSWDNTAKIWDVATGRAITKLEAGHSQNVNTALFSPDAEGRFLLTASDDATAKLWDATTGRLVQSYTGHTDRVRSAKFSPDGQLVLTASADRTARIWNTETGQLVHELAGHDDGLLAAAFSTDSRWVVTGGEDNTARVFDAATGQPRPLESPIEGHTASVTAVAFSPDGRRILTGSQDNTAKLWDAATGREILTLRGHGRAVTGVRFSPDGRQILTGSRDGTALLWPTVGWND